MLHDDALKRAVDVETAERFLVGAEVNDAKIGLYLQHAQDPGVIAHLQALRKGNSLAARELEKLVQHLRR